MTFFQILPSVLSILSTVIIALVGWGYRSDRAQIKSLIQKNTDDIGKVDQKHADKIEKLESGFNDLKADLPMIFVLREDHIRVMNNVETNIRDVANKMDRVLAQLVKGGSDDG